MSRRSCNASLITDCRYGPPSVVGDVVFSNQPLADDPATFSLIPGSGGIVALHSKTGEVLLEKELDQPFHLGVAIQDEYILFGTGYVGFQPTGSLYVMRVG